MKLEDVKKAILNTKTLEELYNVLNPLLDLAIPSPSPDEDEEWRQVRYMARQAYRRLRREFCAKYPDINLHNVPSENDCDLTVILDLCVDAMRLESSRLTEQSSKDKTTPTKKLTPAQIKAHESYKWVCEQRPDLIPEPPARYSLEMYNHVKEYCPEYHDDEGNSLSMPEFESWKRYNRGYEQVMDGPKNSSRTGRPQPEIAIKPDSIQDLSEITNQYGPD